MQRAATTIVTAATRVVADENDADEDDADKNDEDRDQVGPG